MITHPVIELADLFYAHEYGWLDALPEPGLRRVFKSGFTIRGYLARRGRDTWGFISQKTVEDVGYHASWWWAGGDATVPSLQYVF